MKEEKKMSTWIIVGLLLLVCALVAPAMAVVLPSVACPVSYGADLNSCTAKDIVTTIDSIHVDNYECDTTGNVTLTIQTTYDTTANQRYDLGIFIAEDGGSVQNNNTVPLLPMAQQCVGVAPQVGTGLPAPGFLKLDTEVGDTCGDIAQGHPVSISFTTRVKCVFDANKQNLVIPACRVWEQNANQHFCTNPGDAGTGSKCECAPFSVPAPKANLTLVKTVINDNGGTKVVADFPLKVGTTGVTSGVKNEFTPGTYTASETPQAGYAASVWGGDCSATGSVTLLPGDNKVCTITNDDIAPKLTLIKTVTNDNGGTKVVGDFTLKVDGGVVTNGTANVVTAGLHTASEVELAGYAASVWGTDCAPGGTITLLPGDNKVCTITNDDILQVTGSRTLGFWQTHTVLTSQVFATNFSSGMNIGIAPHKGLITNDPGTGQSQLFGAFYAAILKTTTKAPRSPVDQARITMLQQLVAAKLNAAVFGASPSTTALISAADAAYAAGDVTAMKGILPDGSDGLIAKLDAYNNSGETVPIPALFTQGSATPKTSQSYANLAFWDAP